MSEQMERMGDYSHMSAKLVDHDRHLDILSQAIDNLTATGTRTVSTLDKLVDAMNEQNVLAEKVSNIDKNIAEGFTRRDARIGSIEAVQIGQGCSNIQTAKESINSLGRSMDTLKTHVKETKDDMAKRVERVEEHIEDSMSVTVVRWAVGLILVGIVTSYKINANDMGNLNEDLKEIHKELARLDTLAESKIHMQRQINLGNADKFKQIEGRLNK